MIQSHGGGNEPASAEPVFALRRHVKGTYWTGILDAQSCKLGIFILTSDARVESTALTKAELKARRAGVFIEDGPHQSISNYEGNRLTENVYILREMRENGESCPFITITDNVASVRCPVRRCYRIEAYYLSFSPLVFIPLPRTPNFPDSFRKSCDQPMP
jgi:hypothetical protein